MQSECTVGYIWHLQKCQVYVTMSLAHNRYVDLDLYDIGYARDNVVGRRSLSGK